MPAGKIDHHLADLTATFSADVTLSQAQQALGEKGQWLPIDGELDAPLGSLVEANSTGPLRLGFGAWRDLLLGVQFLNGNGELITAGGRSIKNVAGYDLTKFMVGQFGVFGEIATLTTRTYKTPEQAVLATFDPDVKILSALLVTPCRPQWSVLTSEALHCGYLGDKATADFYEQNVPHHNSRQLIRHDLDDDISLRKKLWAKKLNGRATFRASVPPARIRDFVNAGSPNDWSADAAFGIVVGACAVDQQERLKHAAGNVGGSVIFFREDRSPENLSLDNNVASLLLRLKDKFDPAGVLNPLPLQPR